MSTVKALIRVSKTKQNTDVHIRFRLSDGRGIQLFHVSELMINSSFWDTQNECVKAKASLDQSIKIVLNKSVLERKSLIYDLYNAQSNKFGLTSEWLEKAICKTLHPQDNSEVEDKQNSLFDTFDTFLDKSRLTEKRKKHYHVLKRTLLRFQLYLQKFKNQNIILSLDTLSSDTLHEFEKFLLNEHLLCKQDPSIFKEVKDSRTPQERGYNTIEGFHKRLRCFVKWTNDTGITTNDPYKNFKIKGSVYGDPFYLTIEERNHLYQFDLSKRTQLGIQRDIFVFQCLIGCRIGDLMRMTKANIMGDAIEYIAQKTKDELPTTIHVPLNAIARKILNRYADGVKLLPFISSVNYNLAIKEMFLLADLTRMVTVINPTDRKVLQRPLNEIASSHLARRTFIANLYKKGNHPDKISSLSGHSVGSRAFYRYRSIDEEMKIDMTDSLM